MRRPHRCESVGRWRVALPPRHGARRILSATCAIALLALTGCQRPHAPADAPAAPASGNAALVEYIADQPFVTADAAYRAAYVLWKGSAFAGDYASLSAELVAHNIADRGWRFPANEYIDRGTAAYLVCRAADIRGGVNWTLTGLSRYAWRELQYRNIAGPESDWGLIRGGEFLGIVQRADDERVRREGAQMQLGERRN